MIWQNTGRFLQNKEKQLIEPSFQSETLPTPKGISKARKSSAVFISHEPECLVKLWTRIHTLSGQACLAIVRGRLIRTKRYHDYKQRIAANVGAEMMLHGVECAPRGTLYRVEIAFTTKGWGVDTDNAAKAILDALIGVAIDDDRGVVELEIKKQTHSKEEHLGITVYAIGRREVAAPAEKRASNPKTPTRARAIRKSTAQSLVRKRRRRGPK